MQYMMMIYAEEASWGKLPDGKVAEVMAEYVRFTEQIVKSGHFRSCALCLQ